MKKVNFTHLKCWHSTFWLLLFMMAIPILGSAQPTTNAPEPTAAAIDVASVYGDFYPTNIATNYDPFWGQSGHTMVDPSYDPGTGDVVLAYPNFNYQGTELNSTDLSGMEFLNFDVWTAANSVTTILQVSPINQGTGPIEVLVTVPYASGEWTSVSLPIGDFTGMTWDDVFQMKFAANGVGSIVPVDIYLDNIYFSRTALTAPVTNAPEPTCDAADVVSIYGDFYPTNIATNYDPFWGQSGHTMVDPSYDPGTGDVVLAYPNFNYQGTELTAMDLSAMTHLNFDVWTTADPASTTLQVSPINQGTGPTEVLVDVPYTPGEWTSISLPIGDFTGMTWDDVFQMKFAANGPGSTVPVDIYLDNIYFSACGPALTAPITNAPEPTCDPADVVSIYGDFYPTPIATNYDPFWGQSGHTMVDPSYDPGTGDVILAYPNFNYQGTELTAMDLSAMTHLNFDVWTAADPATTFLQVSPINQGAGPTEVLVDVPYTSGEWTSVSLPIGDFTGMTWDDVFQMKFAANGPGSTVPVDIYLDNIYFTTCAPPALTAPITNAPEPTCDPADVVSIYGDFYPTPIATNYDPFWGQSGHTMVDPSYDPGTGDVILAYPNFNYQGTELTAMDLSAMTHLNFDVWTAADPATTFLQVSPINQGAGPTEVLVDVPYTSGEWTSVSLPIGDFTGMTWDDVFQMKFAANGPGSTVPVDIYLDNIYFTTCAPVAPTAPTTNAPEPTCDPADVVSIYGDFYPTPIATNYDPFWGQSGHTMVNTAYDPGTGDVVLAYPNFNYQGTELTAMDLSAMTYLNFDVWTAADPATTFLQVSPINQGAGPTEVLVDVPYASGEWTSVSLPINAFGGMTWDDVFQMKFAANGPGSTVPVDIYLDNIYFSTCGPALTGANITLCLDVNNCGISTAAAALVASSNGYSNNMDFLNMPGTPGIVCTTVNLAAGDYMFQYFTAEGQFEDLSNAPCASFFDSPNGAAGDYFRNFTVVDGEDQTLTYGWESCDESCPEPPSAEITFCADLNCLPNGAAAAVMGSFNNFNPGADFLDDDDGNGVFDGIFCKTVTVPEGDHTFRFFTGGEQGEIITEGSCTTTGANPVLREFTVVEDVPQTLTYAWGFCEEEAVCPIEGDITITDPCVCNGDNSPILYDAATGVYDNPNDGTFGEIVTVSALVGVLPDGLDIRVTAVSDAIGVAVDDALTFDAGVYSISFDHPDDIGYSLTVDQFIYGNAIGLNLVISNKCAYPNPVFDPALDAIYCDIEELITLGGTDADDVNGIGDGATFTVSGAAATEFNPMTLPAGFHTIVMTYDATDDGNDGISPDGGTTPAYRGCTQDVETVVEVEDFGPACIGDVNVTLGDDCSAIIRPEMVLTGKYDCADSFVIRVDDQDTDALAGCGDHTYSIDVIVAGEIAYTCWGNIFAEDKTDPIVDCVDDIDQVTTTVDARSTTGSLEVTDAQINLNNYSCFTDIALNGDHYYDLVTFTTGNAEDVYTLDLVTDFADGNMVLFQGAFNADNPCENVIGSEDDAFVPNNNPFDPSLRLSLPLRANETYTVMVTTWGNDVTGDWELIVYSDNGGQVSGTGFSAAPQQFTSDLICNDIDALEVIGEETYVVRADGSVVAGTMSGTLRDILDITGRPVITDNCGDVYVTVSDVVSESGDCGEATITRTFHAADRYNSVCIGDPRTAFCTQVITFRKPTIDDVVFPPFTVAIECDEDFAVDANGNPHPSVAGYPWLRTALGFQSLDQSYCNLGASYSDEPRIVVCEGTYKFRREWNLIDWCDPGSSLILNQLVKVGDFTGPAVTFDIPDYNNDGDADAAYRYSTSPFDCYAHIPVAAANVEDGNGCSGVGSVSVTITDADGFVWTGDQGDVATLPVGDYVFTYCATDGCGNETCEDVNVIVRDEIEPTASCNDELNVSIGGGDVHEGVYGEARIYAEDVNEGSSDNCGEVTVQVRRNYWRNGTCDASANRWSPWGDYIDFYCCDIDNEITIELRVTDEVNNTNMCWMVITPEDKLVPYCYPPQPVTLSCAALPLAFPGDIQAAYDEDFEGTSQMMDDLFGYAWGTDNCAVDAIVERTPNIQINDCGWGTIQRRFEVWQWRPEGDLNGNGELDRNEAWVSTNSCSQLITITETHDFVIDFPEDAAAECGDPDIATIITEAEGCDILAINIGDPVRYSATGDECYKLSITYDVINWCLWDGEYTGYVLDRMTEDDGEQLPVDRAVEGNERPVITYTSADGLCIDRRHTDRDGDSSLANCDSPTLPNYGRYIYTQFVKVYDATAPVVTVDDFGGATDLCPTLEAGQFGDPYGVCEAAVSLPFSVSDECELFDGEGELVISLVSATVHEFSVDANGDGVIKSNELSAGVNVTVTDNGDGTYKYSGTHPIITNAMGEGVYHALHVLLEDGCGNQVSEIIAFDVIDCKGPAPICINGLTVTLMPQEEGGCAMAIWASDFEGSPIYDCTGQGPEVDPTSGLPRVTKYAVYRATVADEAGFVPVPTHTAVVLTEDDLDEETVNVYVYGFDEDGNYDYCETYVNVEAHVDCGTTTGTLSGVITTENDETVEGVEVNVNSLNAMTTTTNGAFEFDLEIGGDYTVTPYLNENPLNGVSTFDLVLMSKHILGVQLLDTPYKLIAADVNRSTTITTLDMIQLRKLILNIDTEFSNNTSWRFVPSAHGFADNTNPWSGAGFPELGNVNNFQDGEIVNFIAVKTGDVNGNAAANLLSSDDRTLNGQFNFEVENVTLKADNTYTVPFTGADMASVEGYQATLALAGAELVDVEYGVAQANNFGLRFADQGMITTSWNGEATSEDVLFNLVIRATADAQLSEVVKVSSRYTAAEAYANGTTANVAINFSTGEVVAAGFELYQNTPNPFAAETMIGFNLPADAKANITISDASGRVLTVIRKDFSAGYNTQTITKAMVNGATGVLSYTVTAGDFTATKSMIAVK